MREVHFHKNGRDPVIVALLASSLVLLFVVLLSTVATWMRQSEIQRDITALRERMDTQDQIDRVQDGKIGKLEVQSEQGSVQSGN